RRQAWNDAEDLVAVALVEVRRLEIDRIEQGADAAALPSLFLRKLQQAAAEPMAGQVVGEEEEIDEQHTERGPACQSTDLLPGFRITDDDRQRSTAPEPALLLVEARQARADRMIFVGGRRIGEDHDRLGANLTRHGGSLPRAAVHDHRETRLSIRETNAR